MNLYLISKRELWGCYFDMYVIAAVNQKDAIRQLDLSNFICQDENGTFIFEEGLDVFLVDCTKIGIADEDVKRSILLEHHHDRS